MTTTTKSHIANDDENLPLTERMRERSRDLHDQSDKVVNLKLALALTSKPLYAEAISLFWPIYRELESLLEKHREHAQVGLLYPLLPQLRRAHLFEDDIASLLGNKSLAQQMMTRRRRMENGEEKFLPPELHDYIHHLRKLSEEDPLLLVPYFHSMYGAIFAGGSIIKRMVKRAFSLKTDAGVEMFNVSLDGSRFQNIAEFRTNMKRKIDEEMNIADEDKTRIVNESPQVFLRNNALVATAQDTDAFKQVWSKCRNYLLIIPTIAAALLGIWAIRVRSG